MSDLTVHAERLIAAVVRAFYDDDAVCLIDVMIRDKFLRDDDMQQRLQLPSKKLRATLQFLQDEHLVNFELVDDLAQGGSQATKFWYIDYNQAVHTITLRLHLLQKELVEAASLAESSSFYQCPGFIVKRCNGMFTEEEAQQVVDPETNDFLCIYCYNNFKHDQSMPKKDYTLTLLDNTRELKIAKNNLRRFEVQMKGKMIGDQQLRPGIFELLRKTRGKGKDPITSNLPSENYAMGRGSKRIVGTGRTAAIKARKLEQQGVAQSAQDAQKILVGGKHSAEGDLMFLKNAMGNNIGLRVEKGGGFRAKHLVANKRQRQKIMDAAAARVGTSVPLDYQIKEMAKQRQDEEEKKKNGSKAVTANGTAKQLPGTSNMDWLSNNISRQGLDLEMEKLRQKDMDQDTDDEDDDDDINGSNNGKIDVIVLEGAEDEDALYLKDEETRKKTFQHLYFTEIGRQQEILKLKPEGLSLISPSARRLSGVSTDGDGESIAWEDA